MIHAPTLLAARAGTGDRVVILPCLDPHHLTPQRTHTTGGVGPSWYCHGQNCDLHFIIERSTAKGRAQISTVNHTTLGEGHRLNRPPKTTRGSMLCHGNITTIITNNTQYYKMNRKPSLDIFWL